MPFSTELDAFLAKVQIRIDAAVGEARQELLEMALEAEKELAALRQRVSDACGDSSQRPTDEPPSHSETPAAAAGDPSPE